MIRPLSVDQMRRIEARAIRRYAIPELVLMDQAGRCVAEAVRRLCPDHRRRVIVLCGGGKNGGDGCSAARYLKGWRYDVEILWTRAPGDWTGSAAKHYEIARRMGVPFRAFARIPSSERLSYLRHAAVLVDALLGTGTRGPLRLPAFDAIATLNAAKKPVIAVDLPSGLDADTGRPRELAVQAKITVTMAAPKKGLLKKAARRYVGQLIVADIGLPTGWSSA